MILTGVISPMTAQASRRAASTSPLKRFPVRCNRTRPLIDRLRSGGAGISRVNHTGKISGKTTVAICDHEVSA